jgi:hypothetical protein
MFRRSRRTRKASPSAISAPSSSPPRCSGRAGISPRRCVKKSPSPRAASSCAASCTGRLRPLLRPQPAHRRHRGQGQQPRAVGDGMQQALELRRDPRRAVRHQQQRRRLPRSRPHRPAAPPSSATRARRSFPTPAELWQRYCAWKGLTPARRKRRHRRNALLRRRQRQGPALLPGQSPSTAPSRPSPAGSTASCWSWPPAPARPTPPSRSSGGCGSRARRSASFSSSTATSSPTRPRPTTSSPSARR